MNNPFRARGRRLFSVLGLLCLFPGWPAATLAHWPDPPVKGEPLPEATLDVESLSLSNLFYEAQVYAPSPQARANKTLAREAFLDHGPEALAFLMDHIHIDNLWIRVLAFQEVRKGDAETVRPVLLPYLNDDREAQVKYALFLLGFHPPPEEIPDLRPYLDREKTQNSALRLMGKWKQDQWMNDILPSLKDPNERTRIAAVNSLGSLEVPSALPYLVEALNDEWFTVRKSAVRVLRPLVPEATEELREAMDAAEGFAAEELRRLLAGRETP